MASVVSCEECLQSSTRQFSTLPLFLVVQTLKVSQKWELRAFLLSFLCRCTAWACVVKVSQLCPILCDPLGLYSPWNSPSQNTGVGSRSLLQGIFPTQGLNLGLPHCRQILYQLSHQGSPRILEWVAIPFSNRSSLPRNWTGSPSLWADSLLIELSGKPEHVYGLPYSQKGAWAFHCFYSQKYLFLGLLSEILASLFFCLFCYLLSQAARTSAVQLPVNVFYKCPWIVVLVLGEFWIKREKTGSLHWSSR